MKTVVETTAPDMRAVLIAFVRAVADQLQINSETARMHINEVCSARLNCDHARATWQAIRQVENEAVNHAFIAGVGVLPAHYRSAVSGWQFANEIEARTFLLAISNRVTQLLLAQMFILGKIEC